MDEAQIIEFALGFTPAPHRLDSVAHARSHSAGRKEGGLEPHGRSLCSKLEAKLGCMRPTYIDGGEQ